MVIAPIDFEVKRKRKTDSSPRTWRKKRYVPKPKKPRSVFIAEKGTLELYQNGELVRSLKFADKKTRNKTMKQWEMWIKNLYQKHIFWIHIIPKDLK